MAIDLKKYLPGGDVLKPDDLKGQTVTTTIQQLSERKWDDGNMSLYAHIQGKDGERRVKVNGAACEAMQVTYGAVVEQWVGKRVKLEAAGAGQWRHISVRPA